jgi:hypothetical protein
MRRRPAYRVARRVQADLEPCDLGGQLLCCLGGDTLKVREGLGLRVRYRQIVMTQTLGEFDVGRMDLLLERRRRTLRSGSGLGLRRGTRRVHLGLPVRLDRIGLRTGSDRCRQIAGDLAFARVHVGHDLRHHSLADPEIQDAEGEEQPEDLRGVGGGYLGNLGHWSVLR